MKVYIGPYKNWIGPYQIAEKILFWKDKSCDAVRRLGNWFDSIKWLVRLCEWIDSKRHRKIKVRIDKYDTWNMDYTLAHIILPMLKQLKETQQGAPQVDLEDVPEELRVDDKVHPYDEDGNYFKRWQYVLNEMLFAFESQHNDWKDEFLAKDDFEAIRKVEERIQNGFRLFGKYYQALWD